MSLKPLSQKMHQIAGQIEALPDRDDPQKTGAQHRTILRLFKKALRTAKEEKLEEDEHTLLVLHILAARYL